MRTEIRMSRALVALLLGGALTLSPARADEGAQVVTDTGSIVSVTDVSADESGVSGTLVNRTNGRLVDVTLAVADSFRWKNEFHPGEDDPGGASNVVVHGPIEPNASMPFRITRQLPTRRDGWFETRVDVVQLTMFEASKSVVSADR